MAFLCASVKEARADTRPSLSSGQAADYTVEQRELRHARLSTKLGTNIVMPDPHDKGTVKCTSPGILPRSLIAWTCSMLPNHGHMKTRSTNLLAAPAMGSATRTRATQQDAPGHGGHKRATGI